MCATAVLFTIYSDRYMSIILFQVLLFIKYLIIINTNNLMDNDSRSEYFNWITVEIYIERLKTDLITFQNWRCIRHWPPTIVRLNTWNGYACMAIEWAPFILLEECARATQMVHISIDSAQLIQRAERVWMNPRFSSYCAPL